jgi:hypothetical protein
LTVFVADFVTTYSSNFPLTKGGVLWDKLVMPIKNDNRATVKLTKDATEWARRVAKESSMNLTIPQIVETAMRRSRTWIETNTPRKSRL